MRDDYSCSAGPGGREGQDDNEQNGVSNEGQSENNRENNLSRSRDENNLLDEVDNPRHSQRSRNEVGFTMPQPHNSNASTLGSIRRTSIVNLNTLTDPDAEPSIKRAIVLQILRIIAHNPHVQNGSSAQTYSRPRGYGPARPSSMPYTRLILCRVYSEDEGSVLAYLMESPSKNTNTNLWLNNVELRDNGIVTVGTILRIVSPLPVTSYLRGDIPILQSNQPAIVLQQPSTYHEVPPLQNLQGEKSRSFLLNHARLSIQAYSCEKTKCGGSFCDRQRLNEWNNPLGTCGCYAQRSRGTSNLTLLFPLIKVTHDGNVYVHHDFSSHQFSLGFLNRDFPIGVQSNDLQLSDAFWDLGETIEDIVTFVNGHGGWTVIGWYSRGVINDRTLTGVMNTNSTAGTNNVNNAEVQVDGSGLTFHFVKIIPTDSTLLNRNSYAGGRYDEMKFDVGSIGSTVA